MPNWCECTLTVRGKTEDVKTFVEFAKKGDLPLSFDRFIPYPEKFKELDRIAREYEEEHPEDPWKNRPTDGFNQGGYEWCVVNWDTKWDLGSDTVVNLDLDKGTVYYSFDTAWSPPIAVVKKMSEMFPKLKFCLEYWESGIGFCGEFVIKNKDVAKDMINNAYHGSRGG